MNSKIKTFIPYGKQTVSEKDIMNVCEVLRSDWLTQGPTVGKFEKAISKKCNSKYAVAVNSATSALHISCLALGVGPEDTVWTSPITFLASANCAHFCGAKIDFVDIDPNTWCMSSEKLHLKLEEYRFSKKRLPKVVIPVHLSGQSCDMIGISKLAKEYGFKILEDASHAIGGSYLKKPIGNCQLSDITVFSFHPVKNITAGEGGMALTNSQELNNFMIQLRSHGITRDSKTFQNKPEGPWYYEQSILGFNYRMSDIHAALGLSQLSELEEFVKRRNTLSLLYEKSLTSQKIKKQFVPRQTVSARHLYVIRVPKEKHFSLFEKFRQENIYVNLHYMPVHLQPYYQNFGFRKGNYLEAERYGQEAISLPLYPSLTEADQERVIGITNSFFKN